jgi:p-aminobenzoyl-glutamate transporter AbgT
MVAHPKTRRGGSHRRILLNALTRYGLDKYADPFTRFIRSLYILLMLVVASSTSSNTVPPHMQNLYGTRNSYNLSSHTQAARGILHAQILLLNNIATLRPAFATPSLPAQWYTRSPSSWGTLHKQLSGLITGAKCCKSKLLLTTILFVGVVLFPSLVSFPFLSACSWWLFGSIVTPRIPAYLPNHLSAV